MVKHAIIALLALSSVAHAQEATDEEPAFNLFGFRVGVGGQPMDGHRTTAISIGVGVEHPPFKKTRVFGEYEWQWLMFIDDSERAMDSVVMRPERHASGHHATLGLRRELTGKRLGRSLRMFVDGELGGGVALVNDNMTGVALVPSAILGLRFGYDIYSREDDSPSRTFEAEFLLRAVAVPDGIGGMFGVGMLWGN